MKYSGAADMPLYGGKIPDWLFERMVRLSRAVTEAILQEYGADEFLSRLSDPFWFQSFGAVIGMDWNSSGVTTAVTSALKAGINRDAASLGLYVCGGKGKQSMQTPAELMMLADKTGMNGEALVRASKLTAKVDNTAIQDGHQIYLHSFVVSAAGKWAVVQQGMDTQKGTARRYHWHSESLQSFVEEPHTAVCGDSSGLILNLVAQEAGETRGGIMQVAGEDPQQVEKEIRRLRVANNLLPTEKEVDLKRLGAILWAAKEVSVGSFEDLLLLKGLGPRTLQSLTLVSEIIYSTPSRFSDPARFSFAHGGKGGKPFPVPVKVYDETIGMLQKAVEGSKMGQGDKLQALGKLTALAKKAEENFTPTEGLDKLIEEERNNSWKYGGRSIYGVEQEKKE